MAIIVEVSDEWVRVERERHLLATWSELSVGRRV